MALRCLIVDDSEQFLSSASRLLESQGLQVVGCASSGDEAVRLVAQWNPNVVLVDVQLGEEDGFELTRRLCNAPGPTRVILISTHPEDELVDLIAESSAVGFVPKTALSAAAITELLD